MKLKLNAKIFFWVITFCATCTFDATNCLAGRTEIDSLVSLLQTDKEDTLKIIHMNDLSRLLINANSFDSAIRYGNSALQLSENLLKNADYNSKLVAENGIAASCGNIAIVYYNQGDFPRSLDYFLKALKVGESLKDTNRIAKTLGNIGLLYSDQNEYLKALDYYFRAYKMDEARGNKRGMAIRLGNIGIAYQELGKMAKKDLNRQADFAKALDYYSRALKISEELKMKTLMTSWLSNIGNIYLEEADYEKAFDYYDRALKMDEELGNKKGMSIRLSNIGALYTKEKKYAAAEIYLQKALKLDQELGEANGEMSDEFSLSEVYEKTGKPDLALVHYKKGKVLKDTLFNQEKNKELTRKAMNYEFDKKQTADNARHEREMTLAEVDKKRQVLFFWFSFSGLLVTVAVALIIFRSLRVTRTQKMVIEAQKKLVEEQKRFVEEKQKEVMDSIHYAKRIQRSILPTEKYIKRNIDRLNKKNIH